jgi:GDP-L-fucose synthase
MSQAKKENAAEFPIWGTGKQRREFLYVDDLAEACILLLESKNPVPDLINIGSGEDVTIKELAFLIQELLGYQGKLSFDTSKPDGTHQKLLDVSKMKALGWQPKISLREGIMKTIKFYQSKI